MPQNSQINTTTSVIKPMYEYLQKQKDNQKFFQSLEIAATFILISFFLIFAIFPTASAISSLEGEIQSKQLLTSKLKSKINDVIAAQDTFAQIQEKYPLINSSLPDRPKYYEVANQVAGAMIAQGVVPSKFTFNLTDDKNSLVGLPKNVKSYSINYPINTSFANSKSLLTSLINNRRSSSIPEVTFILQETETGNQLGLNLNAIYYYWDPSP